MDLEDYLKVSSGLMRCFTCERLDGSLRAMELSDESSRGIWCSTHRRRMYLRERWVRYSRFVWATIVNLISREEIVRYVERPYWVEVPSINAELLVMVASRLRAIGNSEEAIRADAAAASFQRQIEVAIENLESQKLIQDHLDKRLPDHLIGPPRY